MEITVECSRFGRVMAGDGAVCVYSNSGGSD